MATIRSIPRALSPRRPLTLLAVALLAACGSKSEAPRPAATPGPPPGSPVLVGPAGGTVPGPGGVTVTVPPGATATPVTITVSSGAADAPALPVEARVVVPAISLTPHGAAFAMPVVVEIPVAPTAVPDGHQTLVLKAEVGGEWAMIPAFTRTGASVRVAVTDFSFIVVVATQLPPPVTVLPLTLVPVAGQSLPLQENNRPQLVTFDVLNWYSGDCGFGQPAMQTVSFDAVDSSGVVLETGVDAAGYREPVSVVRVATQYSTCYDHRPPFAHPGEGPGPVGYRVSLEFVCPPSFRILDRTPPIAFAHTPGPRYDTLGTGPFPDVVARAGTRPALSIAVLGGPCNYEKGAVDVEWQRSDDGGGSWQAVGKSYRGDAGGYGNMWTYQLQVNSFTPPDVQASDDGALLRAVACYTPPGGTLDCAFSRAARLTVTANTAPSFTAHAADALVSAGATATFAVAAAGTPAPTLQWQSSAPGSGPWTDIAGATSASYTTPPAALADNGTRFRAVATSPVGTATSDPVVLSVGVAGLAPVIVTQPLGLTVGVGGSATLAVDATGTAPLVYQWAHDGADLPGATAAVLNLPSVVAADAGLYTVTVSNGVSPPAVSVLARLTVISAPTIVTQPASVTVNAGQAATFGVTAIGIRTLSYQWMKNGVSIPGATGPLYATPPTVPGDSGAVHSVAIWNTAGTVVSDGALLTVVAPPPPAITSITPNHGPTGGGTPVAIAGSGFQSGATVTVGGAPATSVAFVSSTSLTAVTPAGAAGAAAVAVKNPDGQTAAGAYTYELVTLSVLATLPVGTNVQASAAAVAATFSAPLDCGPVTGTSLQVFEGAAPVPGMVGCGGSILTFQPTPALPTNTTLRGPVDPVVRSLAGATLGTAHDWTFGIAPWTRQVGGPAQDQANAVAVDPAGNVFAVGDTFGGVDGIPLAGIFDAFAVKYSASGAKLWTRQLGVSGALTQGRGAATDAAGNLYVVGSTSGNLDGVTNAGSTDAFVVKFDAAGTKQWTRLLGTAQAETAYAVATDSSGNVHVVGSTGGALGAVNAGLNDLFVAKLDAAGTTSWIRQLGSSQSDVAHAVAVDGAGNVHVAGTTQGGLDGNTGAGSTSTVDGFLVKYDAAGTKQWTRQFGTSVDDWTNGVAADAAGNAYVAGQTYGSLDGNTNAGPAGTSDAFLVKYDAAGVKQWTRQFGSAAVDGLNAVAVDGSGAVFVAGGTNGAIEAGSTNSAGTNLLLARYDAAGNQAWLHQRGSGAATDDNAIGVAADAFGGVFLGGITSGGLDGNANQGSLDAYVVKYGADGTQR